EGNSPKRLVKDSKRNTIVHPPVSYEEHVAVQRENKVRTLLIQALPEDHMPDFHHYDDARDIWMAVKARFQKILSQLNQVQARPDNDDINIKFLIALPSSWSQVALALKTRGGLKSMSFDDLYNKLRSLELDVRIGHNYGVKAATAPIYSAFVGASSSGSKPDQDMIYEDFDQVDQIEMEELDLKWHMAMLSLRINRECIVKTIDDKARYSAYKITKFKTDKPKALVLVDSMVNWSDHEAENKTGVVEKVYGMTAKLNGDHAAKGAASVSDAAAEFAMMGISPQVQNCPLGCDFKINDLNKMYNNLDRLYNDCYIKVQAYQHAVKTLESQKEWYHKTQIALEEKEKKEWEVKFEETLARFDKWKESSKNLNKLINSSMSTRTKLGLGFKQYFGEDEVFDLSIPSTLDPEPTEKRFPPLSKSFVKAGEMHEVLPSITGTFMPTSYKSDLIETQVSYGLNSDSKTSETSSETNDFVSCDNSDKSSDSEAYVSYYVPCKSKAAFVPTGSRNSSTSVNAGTSDSTASRNRPVVNSAGRPNPAGRIGKAVRHSDDQPNPTGWSKSLAPVSAGRPVSAGWFNPAARPYFRPSSAYFNNLYWPEIYDSMYMNEGRWGTAVKPSADNDLGIVDSGCSRSMIGNKEMLDDFMQVKGGIVKFGGGDGRISGRGTIRTSKLDFENVYYVEELQHFNMFSVSQICDKKNRVLFTDTDCLVLTEEFPLPDESQVKAIRCDNGTEFKNANLIELCGEKGIKRDYSTPRTPQQNKVAERKNRTLIEAARTMLADSKLPIMFWTEAVSTACYVLNRGCLDMAKK
nr:ribonuclease H-like domain-containing protein [Tanacetum cinerariifolium]